MIATSGRDRHPVLRRTDRPEAEIPGTVFVIASDELSYTRVLVTLRSGRRAWVHVLAEDRGRR